MISYEDLKDNKYTEEELEKHINDFTYLNWSYISKHQILSEPFIEKYRDKLNWYFISKYQKLSESFIEKHKDLVNWFYISIYQDLSENFILNNLDLIDIEALKEKKNISKELLEKVRFMKELQS
jgi:hypothetical protein